MIREGEHEAGDSKQRAREVARAVQHASRALVGQVRGDGRGWLLNHVREHRDWEAKQESDGHQNGVVGVNVLVAVPVQRAGGAGRAREIEREEAERRRDGEPERERGDGRAVSNLGAGHGSAFVVDGNRGAFLVSQEVSGGPRGRWGAVTRTHTAVEVRVANDFKFNTVSYYLGYSRRKDRKLEASKFCASMTMASRAMALGRFLIFSYTIVTGRRHPHYVTLI